MAFRIVEHTNNAFSAVLDRMIALVDELDSGCTEQTSGWAVMGEEFRTLKKSRSLQLGIGIAIDEHYWSVVDAATADLKERP